jgi:hypothetical protein
MSESVEIQLLREAVRWLRFQSLDTAKKAVVDLLDTEKKRAVFEMTDGVDSARAVARRVGLSHVTINSWWKIWFSAGILFEHDKTYKKLFSLQELGIEPKGASPE